MSLTVNYQRRLYLLVENDQTRALRGKLITVVESKDGTVQMRSGTISFPYSEFGKDDARNVVAIQILGGLHNDYRVAA